MQESQKQCCKNSGSPFSAELVLGIAFRSYYSCGKRYLTEDIFRLTIFLYQKEEKYVYIKWLRYQNIIDLVIQMI